jgi:prepilin-type N-terminal cleavage/methylation domain-containing protein
MNRRMTRGFALIEMLTVIALVGTVAGLVGVVSHSLLRAERTSRAELAAEMTYLRLSRDFRRDVHRASEVQKIPDESDPKSTAGIRLIVADGPAVEYRSADLVVSRSVDRDGAANSSERYDLRLKDAPTFETNDGDGGPIVSLRFDSEHSHWQTLSSRLGRDARHAVEEPNP